MRLNCLEMITDFRTHFLITGALYTWAPTGKMPETVIAFCHNDAGDNFLNSFFEEVLPVRKIYSNYASIEGWVVQSNLRLQKTKAEL